MFHNQTKRNMINTWVHLTKKIALIYVLYFINICSISLTCWSSSNPFCMLWAFLDNIWYCTTHCYDANDVRLSRYENFLSELIPWIIIHCSIWSAIQCDVIFGDHCVDRRSPFNLEVIVSKVTLTWYYRTRCWWSCNRLINTFPSLKINNL